MPKPSWKSVANVDFDDFGELFRRYLMDVLLVALKPPRRRVSFLLGGAVSSSMLRGDSETECLLEDVVEDGLDDNGPFFLDMIAALFSPLKFRVTTGN
jgi:hypothetical protein